MSQEDSLTPERRAGIPDLANKIAALDKDVALMQSEVSRQAAMRKLLWGMSAMLIVQAIAVVFGYGKLVQQFEDFSLEEVQANISTAILVAGQHGEEMNMVRAELSEVRGSLNSVREEIRVRTDDRYRRRDWESNKEWLNAKFFNITDRILHLENEHHGGPPSPSLLLQGTIPHRHPEDDGN